MSLMELFSNPETMHSLSMGDKLIGGCITMLMGMGITFIVLLLLWGFVGVMGRVLNTGRKGDKASKETSAAAAPSVAAPVQAASDDSLIAVITAAVAAYQGAGGAGNLIVRKISRVSGQVTPWSNAAREDCIESRKF
ncbi:MAG: OadG family protein [Clostridiales bacterium]|nr:OadG family protein [Clostridiales bacterium]